LADTPIQSHMEVGDNTCGVGRVVGPIFKKGDWRVSSNYWGITLLSLPREVYSRVLERRLQSNLSFRRNKL